MKKIRDSVVKVCIALACVLSLITPLNIRAADVDTEDVSVKIYPKPQELKSISSEGMEFHGTVDLVMHGTQNETAKNKVKDILKENHIAYKEKDNVSKANATILISTDKDHCVDCGAADNGNVDVLKEKQGYILNASDDINKNGNVTIAAADGEGAYYGVLSFEQMLKQRTKSGKFAEVTISDYPSIKLRGFVEGFYGYPWSFEERMSLIEDASEFKMNTYIYAPKDDPYHKDKWRELYPEKEAEELRQLAEAGKKNNMSFCWNIHPGYGFNYSNDSDYNKLIAKFSQLYDLGVRQFGISYDDLGGSVNGKQQADLINRVNREFVKKKGDVKPLIVVGTRYCNGWGPSMETYFKPFFATLDEDVEVMWTGANTMSNVTKEDYEWPKTQTGVNRNLVSWWNYPVNDYCDGNLMMSPLENLDTDVDNLNGFFLNPMSQAEASKVAIFSGADYSWNVKGFDRTNSWKRAIQELVPEEKAAFERFADNISYIKDGFEFDESRYLTDKISNLNKAIANGAGIKEAATELKKEFETMKQDVSSLKNMKNKRLYKEIATHLEAYNELAQAGIAGMEAFISADSSDMQKTMEELKVLKMHLEKTETFTIKSLETNGEKDNVVKVGEKRIKPMLRDTVVQAQAILMGHIAPSKEGAVIGDAKGIEDIQVVTSKGNFTIANANMTLSKDGTFGIKLPKAMNLSQVIVTSPDVDKLKLQYSLNGITWKDAETSINGKELSTKEKLTGTYVRIKNSTDKEIAIHIENMIIKPVYAVGNVQATTDLGTYQGSMQNTIDGDVNTKFYSSAGATVGSFARVDLGKEIPLYDAAIYFAGNPKGIEHGVDGFAETKMEISTDGATWKQIGSLIDAKDYEYVQQAADGLPIYKASYNADGEMARYIRFTATKASNNWVQIYEIPFNTTVKNLGDAYVPLVNTTLAGGNIEHLYDADISTAYEPSGVKPQDTLTYSLTTTTSVENLTIIQDENNISNASVEVKDLEGSWITVGKLEKDYNTFKIYKDITEARLTFDGKIMPKLYEIMVTSWKKADFSKLSALIDKAELLLKSDLSDVVPSSVNNLKNVLNESKKLLTVVTATQKEIDTAVTTLEKAIQGLDVKKGNKHELEIMVQKAQALQANEYTADSWNNFQKAYKQAASVLANENAIQQHVDSALTALNNAMNALVKVGGGQDKPSQEPNKPNDTNGDKDPVKNHQVPDTGDQTNTMTWLVITIIAGGAIICIALYKKFHHK